MIVIHIKHGKALMPILKMNMDQAWKTLTVVGFFSLSFLIYTTTFFGTKAEKMENTTLEQNQGSFHVSVLPLLGPLDRYFP